MPNRKRVNKQPDRNTMEGNFTDDSKDVDYDQLKFQFEELKQNYEQLVSESRGISHASSSEKRNCKHPNVLTDSPAERVAQNERASKVNSTSCGEDSDEGYDNQDGDSVDEDSGQLSDQHFLNSTQIKKETIDLDFEAFIEDPNKCSVSQAVSLDSATLMHLTNASGSDVQPTQWDCLLCNKIFKHKKILLGHEKVCGKCCGICFKSVSQSSQFRHHVFALHGREDWQCVLMPASSNLSGVKPNICDYEFDDPVAIDDNQAAIDDYLAALGNIPAGFSEDPALNMSMHRCFSIDSKVISTPEFQPKVVLQRVDIKLLQLTLGSPSSMSSTQIGQNNGKIKLHIKMYDTTRKKRAETHAKEDNYEASILTDPDFKWIVEEASVEEPSVEEPSVEELSEKPPANEPSADDPLSLRKETSLNSPSAEELTEVLDASETSTESASEHLLTSISDSTTRHHCHLCKKKSYSDDSTLRGHLKVCGKRCRICHHSYCQTSDFRYHSLVKHKEMDWKSLLEPSVKPAFLSSSDPICTKTKAVDDRQIGDNVTPKKDTDANTLQKISVMSIPISQATSPQDVPDNVSNEISKQEGAMKSCNTKEAEENKKSCSNCQRSYKNDRSYLDHDKVCGKFCSLCIKHYAQASVFQYHALRVHKRMDWESLLQPGKDHTPNASIKDSVFEDDAPVERHFMTNIAVKSCIVPHSSLPSADDNSSLNPNKTVSQVKTVGNNLRSDINVEGDSPLSFQCPKCPETFSTKKSAESHLRYHSFQCYCGEAMCSEKALQKHELLHEFVVKLLVETEKDLFNFPSSIKYMRYDGVPCYDCHICNKTILRTDTFRQHLVSHSAAKPFQCVACKKTFRLMGQAVTHHRLSHLLEKKYPCPVCGKIFITKARVKAHQDILHPTEKHICPDCGACLKSAKSLKTHIERHTKVYRHECKLCGKKYKMLMDLTFHLKNTHTEGQKVRCDVCTKYFKNKGSMWTHRKTTHHNQVFECSLCGKSFNIQKSRDRHQEMHAIWDAKKMSAFLPSASTSLVDSEVTDGSNATQGSSDLNTCLLCHKIFKAKHTYTGHAKVCGKSCSICQKRFEHPHIFRSHAAKFHGVSDWEALLQAA